MSSGVSWSHSEPQLSLYPLRRCCPLTASVCVCLHVVPRLRVHDVEVSYQCAISGAMCVTPHSLNYCISPYSPFITAALQIPEWRTSRKFRLKFDFFWYLCCSYFRCRYSSLGFQNTSAAGPFKMVSWPLHVWRWPRSKRVTRS